MPILRLAVKRKDGVSRLLPIWKWLKRRPGVASFILRQRLATCKAVLTAATILSALSCVRDSDIFAVVFEQRVQTLSKSGG